MNKTGWTEYDGRYADILTDYAFKKRNQKDANVLEQRIIKSIAKQRTYAMPMIHAFSWLNFQKINFKMNFKSSAIYTLTLKDDAMKVYIY